MTTDITELAQSLKAEDISSERMEWLKKLADMEYCANNPGHWLMNLKETNYLASLALQCLESNSTLVEALEKAQQRIASQREYYEGVIADGGKRIDNLESFRTAYMEWGDKTDWMQTDKRFDVLKPWGKHRADVLKEYIQHLESRTVTMKQGEVLVTVAGFTGCGKSAIAGEIEIAMKAIGVPVTLANGDSEKRMTGADWLAAIEMYKPTVRVVEVNIPRDAGIKVEAE